MQLNRYSCVRVCVCFFFTLCRAKFQVVFRLGGNMVDEYSSIWNVFDAEKKTPLNRLQWRTTHVLHFVSHACNFLVFWRAIEICNIISSGQCMFFVFCIASTHTHIINNCKNGKFIDWSGKRKPLEWSKFNRKRKINS